MVSKAGLQLAPLIVNLAPTGAVPTRVLSKLVPLQPSEIVADVLECAKLGVSIVHLHARDQEGRPSHCKDIYARIIGGIRERRPDLVLCVSCSGRGGATLEQRSAVLTLAGDLQPDLASLTLSSLNFYHEASVNPPEVVSSLAARMRDAGIRPELEIFDLGMANLARVMFESGTLDVPLYANLLFGNIATAQARFLEIGAVIAGLPPTLTWSMAGLGTAQLPVAAMAVAAAPGVRIGLEDNLWLDPLRQQPASNPQLVQRVHQMAALLNRPIMTATDLRALLGLPLRS